MKYARKIIFAPLADANKAIDTMRHIHSAVESARGAAIPAWAYRDVLFMLIHYSIAAYELLEHPLSEAEKEQVFNVFYRVGLRMGLMDLPANYKDWLPVRQAHLAENLQHSKYTDDLFFQYRKHLGGLRYRILVEAQKLVVPNRVTDLLQFKRFSLLAPTVPVYKWSRSVGLDRLIKTIVLPAGYRKQIAELDVVTN